MNRKQRRELRKDKNLIKNLYAIMLKYFPDLLNKFYNLTDSRNPAYITYNMKVICVTRLFGLLCGLTSLSTISDDSFNMDACIEWIGYNKLYFYHFEMTYLQSISHFNLRTAKTSTCFVKGNISYNFIYKIS